MRLRCKLNSTRRGTTCCVAAACGSTGGKHVTNATLHVASRRNASRRVATGDARAGGPLGEEALHRARRRARRAALRLQSWYYLDSLILLVSLIQACCVMISWLSPMRARALVRAPPRYAAALRAAQPAARCSAASFRRVRSACTPQLSGCRLGPMRRGAYGCLQA